MACTTPGRGKCHHCRKCHHCYVVSAYHGHIKAFRSHLGEVIRHCPHCGYIPDTTPRMWTSEGALYSVRAHQEFHLRGLDEHWQET